MVCFRCGKDFKCNADVRCPHTSKINNRCYCGKCCSEEKSFTAKCYEGTEKEQVQFT